MRYMYLSHILELWFRSVGSCTLEWFVQWQVKGIKNSETLHVTFSKVLAGPRSLDSIDRLRGSSRKTSEAIKHSSAMVPFTVLHYLLCCQEFPILPAPLFSLRKRVSWVYLSCVTFLQHSICRGNHAVQTLPNVLSSYFKTSSNRINSMMLR